MRNELVSLGVVVSPSGHDVVVGIAVEERLPVSAVTMRIAALAIARMVRGLVPEDVLLGDANDVWLSFDRIERLATAAKTLLAARVEEAGDWKRAGARSAADHMAKLGGTTAHAARRALEASSESPWESWRLLTLETRMELCQATRHRGSRPHVLSLIQI
jgi:hypothetical protein